MANLLRYLDDWVQERIDPPPVVRFLGIKLLAWAEGTARVEMETSMQHHNPMGIVHGGILCDLADVAMGVAAATKLETGQTFSTTDLHIHYFIPVQEGLLTAVGEVVHQGRSTVVVECRISDDRSTLIAKATSTCLIRSRSET
jgi:uncharacterized protein (TIGR00369 family)